MQELRFVGIAEDGESLVLMDDARTRYTLKPTDEIRTAIRRDRHQPLPGGTTSQTPASLRPRDVQGLIRGGVPLEEIAERAGWSLEKVQRYEGPIRAERDYVSELAQAVVLPSRHEQTTLRERADRRLADRGVEAERVVWDSWKSDEVHWTVVVRFPAGGRLREATWQFDPVNRTLRTVDDEARWLGGDELGSADIEDTTPRPGARNHRDVNVYDVEAEGGLADAQAPHLGTAVRKAEASSELASSMRARQASRGRGKSRSATSTRSTTPDVTRVETLDLDTSEPPQPSHPRPGQNEPESARAKLPRKPKGRGEAQQAQKSPQPEQPEQNEQTEQSDQSEKAQTEKAKPARGRASKRGARHVSAAPVRSALIADDEGEDDEELFAGLPGFHDYSRDKDDASDADADVEDVEGADEAERDDAERDDANRDDSERDDSERDDAQRDNAPDESDKSSEGKSVKDVPSRPSGSRRSGRPSVPSWDDIMFGGRGKG